MEKDSRILVAGGTGLVGSALVTALAERGFRNITATVHRRRPPSSPPGVRFENLDAMDAASVAGFFARLKPEYIFVAAARVGGIRANNALRAQFIFENLAMETRLIHNAYACGARKLLFLGSSCIYPRDCPQPIREEHLLTGELEYTNEPYAVAKIAGMKMCEAYNIQYGTNFICAMPTNLYGSGDNFDLASAHVLPAVLRKFHLAKLLASGDYSGIRDDFSRYGVPPAKAEQRPVTPGELPESVIRDRLAGHGIRPDEVVLWGTGRSRRELLYSIDLAEACLFLMECVDAKDLERIAGSTRNTHINVGYGSDRTIAELAELARRTTGFAGAFRFDPSFPDGTPQKLLDLSRMTGLGWRARTPLEMGIRELYGHYLCQKGSAVQIHQ